MLEFNDGSPKKCYLIQFFRNSLKPSIKVQIKNDGQKLHNLEDLVQKAVKAKAKTSLLFLSILQEIDQYVVRNKRLLEYTKSSTQRAFMRDLRIENSKLRTQERKPAAVQLLLAEASNKARKEKKKIRHNRKEERGQEQKAESSNPTTGVNTVDINGNGKKYNKLNRDLS